MKHSIVVRMQCGHRYRKPEWEEYYDRTVARYLEEVSTLFEEGLDENLVFNLDETDFVLNQDNGRALRFLGENTINYAEASNGSHNFTLVPLVRGGFYTRVESLFVIFKNVNESYRIDGVPGEMQRFL